MNENDIRELQRLQDAWLAQKDLEEADYGREEAEDYIAALQQHLWELIHDEPFADRLLRKLSGKS